MMKKFKKVVEIKEDVFLPLIFLIPFMLMSLGQVLMSRSWVYIRTLQIIGATAIITYVLVDYFKTKKVYWVEE